MLLTFSWIVFLIVVFLVCSYMLFEILTGLLGIIKACTQDIKALAITLTVFIIVFSFCYLTWYYSIIRVTVK